MPIIIIPFPDQIRRQMMSFSIGTISQHRRQVQRHIGNTSSSNTRRIWQGYIVPKRQMIFHLDGRTSHVTMPWKTWEKCIGLRKTKNYLTVKVISKAALSNLVANRHMWRKAILMWRQPLFLHFHSLGCFENGMVKKSSSQECSTQFHLI